MRLIEDSKFGSGYIRLYRSTCTHGWESRCSKQVLCTVLGQRQNDVCFLV